MRNNEEKYSHILKKAINSYEGLINLYQQNANDSVYFDKCLREARTKVRGLQERLMSYEYLIDTFKGNYILSIDHFLSSHRGEYGPDMPGCDKEKELIANSYLEELRDVMNSMIKLGNELENEI